RRAYPGDEVGEVRQALHELRRRRGRGGGLRGGLRQDHGGGGGGDDGDQRERADLGAQRAHAGGIVHRLIYLGEGTVACGRVSASSTVTGRKGCASRGKGWRSP